MKVMRVEESTEGLIVVPGTAPKPGPGAGEVLVRVCAAGVTPTELVWSPTTHTKSGGKRSGAVPGHEFSGVVEAVGEDADEAIGSQVYGMNDWFSEGATAEYCIAAPSSLAPKPESLTHSEAASVPIGALTAWQGLVERAKIRPGERLLVHGGAGAVGIFAVQLGHMFGARVIATASGRNAGFVTELGAEQVIDYRKTRFEDAAREIDVVFDTVGGETLDRSWAVLKPGGRMVTIAAAGEQTSEDRVKNAFFIVEPNREQLSEVGRLIDHKKLRAVVDSTVALESAPDAYSGKLRRQGHGKVVVIVDPSAEDKTTRY